MDLSFLPLLLAAGAVAGFLAGLLGIGGGIVTVPAMFLLFGPLGIPESWRMQACVATSLLIIIATSLSSVRAHHRRGGVDWQIARHWAPFVGVGSLVGAQVAQALQSATLVYVFAICATVLASKMFLPLDRLTFKGPLPAGARGAVVPSIIGTLAAIMGIGGGAISVPYMTLFGVSVHRAVGTSALIGLVASLVGMTGFLLARPPAPAVGEVLPTGLIGYIHWPTALVIALVSVAVAPLGVMLAHRLSRTTLSILFGLFIVTAVIRLVTSV